MDISVSASSAACFRSSYWDLVRVMLILSADDLASCLIVCSDSLLSDVIGFSTFANLPPFFLDKGSKAIPRPPFETGNLLTFGTVQVCDIHHLRTIIKTA